MKILIINPNSDVETNQKIEEKLALVYRGMHDIDCICIKNAPKLVTSNEGEAASIPEMIKIVRDTENIYDAYVIACHADANLDILREVTKKPVVGIAEASYTVAKMHGNSFAIICPSKRSISRKYAQTRKYYCNELLKKVIVAQSDSFEDLLKAAKKAAAEDVDVIVLGCANYTLADKELENQVGVPVIDGVACAVFMAAGLAVYGSYKKSGYKP